MRYKFILNVTFLSLIGSLTMSGVAHSDAESRECKSDCRNDFRGTEKYLMKELKRYKILYGDQLASGQISSDEYHEKYGEEIDQTERFNKENKIEYDQCRAGC